MIVYTWYQKYVHYCSDSLSSIAVWQLYDSFQIRLMHTAALECQTMSKICALAKILIFRGKKCEHTWKLECVLALLLSYIHYIHQLTAHCHKPTVKTPSRKVVWLSIIGLQVGLSLTVDCVVSKAQKTNAYHRTCIQRTTSTRQWRLLLWFLPRDAL